MRLNAQQQAAVAHGEGPLLVLAGAGSGKTRVITARIARLLRDGVDPGSMLVVTFTNKAADEMRDRVSHSVGRSTAERLWLSTFHSFGVRFVRQEANALGVGDRFTIFDQGDSLGVVRELLRTESSAERGLDAQAILARISLWKSALRRPEEIRPNRDEYEHAAASIYGAYESRLDGMRAVDFDDLVAKPVRLLRERPAVKRKWSVRFRHILVDEFQDTNEAQLELVRLLANESQNVCVVGDDDQSIYGWRGARVENILEFEQHFPGATVIKLQRNYRSRESILRVANAAIGKASNRPYAKELKPTRSGGDPVRLCVLQEPSDEAKFIGSEIRALVRDGVHLRDIAVLYRSNGQAKLIEEELRVAGVPYRVYGGTKLFDRKEIKDAIAYLRVALNPRDELSLRRIVNTPARGLGVQSLAHLSAHAQASGSSLFRALKQAKCVEALSPRAQASGAQLSAALDCAGKGFREGRFSAPARSLFAATGMIGGADDDAAAKRRDSNVRFLLDSIERVEKRSGADRQALQQLLHRIALDPSDESEESVGAEVTPLLASFCEGSRVCRGVSRRVRRRCPSARSHDRPEDYGRDACGPRGGAATILRRSHSSPGAPLLDPTQGETAPRSPHQADTESLSRWAPEGRHGGLRTRGNAGARTARGGRHGQSAPRTTGGRLGGVPSFRAIRSRRQVG